MKSRHDYYTTNDYILKRCIELLANAANFSELAKLEDNGFVFDIYELNEADEWEYSVNLQELSNINTAPYMTYCNSFSDYCCEHDFSHWLNECIVTAEGYVYEYENSQEGCYNLIYDMHNEEWIESADDAPDQLVEVHIGGEPSGVFVDWNEESQLNR